MTARATAPARARREQRQDQRAARSGTAGCRRRPAGRPARRASATKSKCVASAARTTTRSPAMSASRTATMSGSRSIATICAGGGDSSRQRARSARPARRRSRRRRRPRCRLRRRGDARQHRTVAQEVLPPGLLGAEPVPREHPARILAGRHQRRTSGCAGFQRQPRIDRQVQPGALPAREQRRAFGSDHGGVVGAALGRRDEQREPVGLRRLGQARCAGRGSRPRRRTRSACRSPSRDQRAPRLAHQHVDDGRLEAGAEVRQRAAPRARPSDSGASRPRSSAPRS